MKRLHLVGRSKDDRRLILAKTRGAKFGSFEVPISPKLLKLIREVDETREPKKPAAATPPAAATADSAGLLQEATGLAASGARAAAPAAPPPPPPPEPEPKKGRKKKKEKAPDSKLSPAEIQTMLRAGSSVASVARLAKAPPSWIKRLGEPIRQERIGAIAQMLQARTVRARLGVSGEPVGRAILENLRDRGVPFPERAIEGRFSAQRLEAGGWRIILRYDHRGRRSARWSFDPHRREVVPLNSLARELAWRPPTRAAMAAAPEEEAEPVRTATAPARTRRRAATRRPARKRTPARSRKKMSTRRAKPTARKRSTAPRPRRKAAAARPRKKAAATRPRRKTGAKKSTARKRSTARSGSPRSRRRA